MVVVVAVVMVIVMVGMVVVVQHCMDLVKLCHNVQDNGVLFLVHV